MRNRSALMLTGLLLLPAAAAAQQAASPAAAPAPPAALGTNIFEMGLRGTSFTSGSDQARFQRYRDLRNGPTVDLFNWGKQSSSYRFTVHADHVGYRDQRYSAAYNDYGKLKVNFEWNQIPIYFSQTTATLYSEASLGVLRISDSIRSGIEDGTTTLASAVGQATPFDLREQRDVMTLGLTYSATRNLELNASIKNTTKTGNQPWAGTFGFGDAVELPVPVKTRTTDLGTSAEWSNGKGLLHVGFDGSYFRNDIPTLVWDNPLRITDSTSGPAQGRMAMFPDSNLNDVNANGAINLPLRSRATAYVSLGDWTQNAPLIPFTINSAIPAIALDRPTADVNAVVTAMNYAFTSRPTDKLWVSARFRSYDFDNQTPVFHVTNTVAYDTNVEAFAEPGTSPYSYTRRTFDGEVSLTPVPFTSFRFAFTRQALDETYRTYSTTVQNTYRASVDSSQVSWLVVRGVYEHANRVGSGLDEVTLDTIGEQTSLRQFDIADLTSDRFSGIVIVTPVSSLSFNGSVAAGQEAYPESVFGLQSNDNHSYSVGMDYVPSDAVSFGMSYEDETFSTGQRSRQANPGVQFADPTRDWTTDAADKAQTANASLDLVGLWPKVDVRFAYSYSRARSTYVYGLTADTTLPPVVQLPPVVNQLQRATTDVSWHVWPQVTAVFSYWFDKYSVNDFAFGSQTLTTLAEPSFMGLGYIFAPYTAHTFGAHLSYAW
jgi:MtrB/PioB family decaheme-associated outer membrane protein